MRVKKVIYILCFLLCLAGISCKKDLDRDNPLDEKNSTTLENNENDVDSGIVVTGFDIYSDGNGDEIVNKGESIRLKYYIQNKSLVTVNGVKVTITSSSPYVSKIANYYQLGGYKDFPYGNLVKDQKEDHDGLMFDISEDTPDGTDLIFNVVFESESGQLWTEIMTITTENISATIIYSKSSVYGDSNSDGVINQGESIRMNLAIKNAGSSTVRGLTVKVLSSSPYVSSISNYYTVGGFSSVVYGTIGANQEVSTDGLSFNVSSSTPSGTVIQFDLTMTDFYGNVWTDSFTVTTEALGSSLVYSKSSVYSDGNGDGSINKGEGIMLNLVIKNTGISTAKGVDVTVSSSNPYVSNITNYYTVGGYNDVSFGDLSANQEVTKNGLSFNVSSSAPDGSVITFNITMEGQYGNTWSDSFTVTVAATSANLVLSSTSIYSDSNNNGKAEAGEKIRLTTIVKNTGLSEASGAKASIRSVSNSISSLANYYSLGGYNNVNYGDLTMNQDNSHTGLIFDINPDTPAGTVIVFTVVLADQYGNTWNDTFNLTTY